MRLTETSLGEESNPSKEQQPESSIDQHHDLATTFLSLPREIRQKILVHTFNSKAHQIRLPVVPEGPITHSQYEEITRLGKKFGVRRMWIEGERKKVKAWTNSVSSLHPYIKANMPYVLEGLEKEVEARLGLLGEIDRQFQKELEAVVKIADPAPAPAPAPAQTRVESPKFRKRNYNDDSGSPSPAERKKGTMGNRVGRSRGQGRGRK